MLELAHRRFPNSHVSVLLALLSILTLWSFAGALDVPALRGRVNDYAGILPRARTQALEQRLAQFENETGHQIAVLTIPSLQGEDIESFSIRVAESWKIGKKGFDNGAILVIAQKDRKLRIEVGYGLEGVLPDAIASRIIREIIVPRFRDNDFTGGIEAGVEAIMKVTRGETLPAASRRPARQPSADPHLVLILILSATAAIIAFLIGMHQRTPLRGAALGGGVAAGISTTGALMTGWWLAFAVLVIGIMTGAMGGLFATGSGNRPWSPASARRGGWRRGALFDTAGAFGGLSDSGGGSSGGDFSGGGGDFGGGGASGDW